MTLMPSFITSLCLVAALWPTASIAAEPIAPGKLVGKYAFGYGDKLRSKCLPVTKKLVQKFDVCEWEKEELSYSQKTDFYTCQVMKSDDEYRVYNTKSRCMDELGTMNANAP